MANRVASVTGHQIRDSVRRTRAVFFWGARCERGWIESRINRERVVRDTDGGRREMFEEFSGRFWGSIEFGAVLGRFVLRYILARASIRRVERHRKHKDDRKARGADLTVFDAYFVHIHLRVLRRYREISSHCVFGK